MCSESKHWRLYLTPTFRNLTEDPSNWPNVEQIWQWLLCESICHWMTSLVLVRQFWEKDITLIHVSSWNLLWKQRGIIIWVNAIVLCFYFLFMSWVVWMMDVFVGNETEWRFYEMAIIVETFSFLDDINLPDWIGLFL